MIVQFTYTEGMAHSVANTIKDILDCTHVEATNFATQGFVDHLTPEKAEALYKALSQITYTKEVSISNTDAEKNPSENANSVDEEDESITISFTPKEGCTKRDIFNVFRSIAKSDEAFGKRMNAVRKGYLKCPMEDWLKMRDELQKVANVCVINDGTEDLPAVVDAEEVHKSEIMVASEVDEDTNESITVVLCLITLNEETFEKFKNNRKRISGVLRIVGSIIPQIRRICIAGVEDKEKQTLMVALESPTCAIALDKATELGEFAEAIGESIIDFVDNDFNETRIRAIESDLAPLYAN